MSKEKKCKRGVRVNYIDIYEKNKNSLSPAYGTSVKRICKKMDEKNIKLETLTQDQYLEVFLEVFANATLGLRFLRYALATIRFLYAQTNIKMPKEIQALDVELFSKKITNAKQDWGFFKNIESVIAHIEKLNWGDFSADIKVVCILAWHGISVSEMIVAKNKDINFNNNSVNTQKHGSVFLSDFEMGIIKHYQELSSFITPSGKVFHLVSSDYLFRPCTSQLNNLKNTDRLSSTGVKSKILKLNKGFEAKKLYPTISVHKLSLNGDFWGVYTSNLSKFIFDKNRQVQYEQYLQMFWK